MVTGLVKKRAEITGEIERVHERLRQLAADLEHIDGTLRIVAPDMQVEAIRPKLFKPPEDWSKRGQMSRMVLSIIRTAKEPLTTREIATELLIQRGMGTDRKLLALMTKRVSCALRDKREKGLARSSDGPGQYALWEVVR